MTLDPPIDAIYSSPYYRCLQTITPFVELKQQQLNGKSNIQGSATATVCPEYGIGEFFGAAPFDHPIPASPKRLKELFPAYDDSYVPVITPSRTGETINDLYERVATAVQGIIDRCDADGKRAVVLCTHAAVVIALGRVLTGQIPDAVEEEDFHAFTCGLSTYRRRDIQRCSRSGLGKFVFRGCQIAKLGPGMLTNILIDESHASISERKSLGEWQCIEDSDCSFLSSGGERGW